jgi:hypothetical protein
MTPDSNHHIGAKKKIAALNHQHRMAYWYNNIRINIQQAQDERTEREDLAMIAFVSIDSW